MSRSVSATPPGNDVGGAIEIPAPDRKQTSFGLKSSTRWVIDACKGMDPGRLRVARREPTRSGVGAGRGTRSLIGESVRRAIIGHPDAARSSSALASLP